MIRARLEIGPLVVMVIPFRWNVWACSRALDCGFLHLGPLSLIWRGGKPT